MITQQQVSDLRVGDIVQIEGWYGLTVQGPVSDSLSDGSLWLGQYIRLTYADGGTGHWLKSDDAHLVLIARAKLPLYVNHPRTEPVTGDVVRDADNDEWNGWLYLRSNNGRWLDSSRGEWFDKAMPARLRLLVDGETGQVVQ